MYYSSLLSSDIIHDHTLIYESINCYDNDLSAHVRIILVKKCIATDMWI